ncbi:hypothetical protein GCM10009682_43550 [Luedemannella flava]|uniref:ABC transporter permease n=1 Tax=Luedemannella flava TaxID=349316 RepID=A0ABP4YJS4_9ACTN
MSLLAAERRRFFKRRVTRWTLGAVVLILIAIAVVIAWYSRQPPADRFVFRTEFEPLIFVLAGLMGLFGFIVGASYVGAEWHTGAMLQLLAWRPRRVSVLLTKLATALGAVLAVTLVLGALWTVALWAVACKRGDDEGMTTGAWISFGLTGARAVALILALTAVGFCLASLGRHTAVALGAALIVAIVGEVGVRILLDQVQVPSAGRYLLSSYGAAWLTRSWPASGNPGCVGDCGTSMITWPQAGLVLGSVVLIVLVAAIWNVRRRDVT